MYWAAAAVKEKIVFFWLLENEWCVCKHCWENLASETQSPKCEDTKRDNLPATHMPIDDEREKFKNIMYW